MARRHLRLREPGWKLGLFLNGTGAVSTLVVTAIIAVVKFAKGAWVVVLFVPVLVAILVKVNRTYEAEEEDLMQGLGVIDRPLPRRHVAVVLVEAIDQKTCHALQYALTIRPQEIIPVHLVTEEGSDGDLAQRWKALEMPGRIRIVQCGSDPRPECLGRLVRELATGLVQVTVIVPGPSRLSFWQRVRRGRTWSGLVRPLRDLDNVSVVVVRDHGGRGHPWDRGRIRLAPRPRHVAVILVDRLDRSVLKAIRYARSIQAFDIRALHAGVDPGRAQQLAEQWADVGPTLAIPLDLDECFDRDVARTVRRYVDELEGEDAEITVIVPRREYPRLLQRFLHDRTSRSIATSLEDEPHVDVVLVPYRVRSRHRRGGRPHQDSSLAPTAAFPTR